MMSVLNCSLFYTVASNNSFLPCFITIQFLTRNIFGTSPILNMLIFNSCNLSFFTGVFVSTVSSLFSLFSSSFSNYVKLIFSSNTLDVYSGI